MQVRTGVVLTGSNSGLIVESGQLRKFTASAGVISAGSAIGLQAKKLQSISAAGSKVYAAGDNGEVYVSSGGGNFVYVPTVGITESFIDLQYVPAQSTVALLSSTGAYTYSEGTPNLPAPAGYTNPQQLSVGTDGVQVAGTTAATGAAYSVDAAAYPYILGADLGKMWYKTGSNAAYTAAAVNILPLSGLAYASSSTIITVGKQGTILISGDAGASWKMVYSGVSADLSAVSASGSKAVAISASGTVIYSGDGGQSWSASGTTIAAPTSVKVTPSAVLVTSGTSVYRSVNGGQSFTAETLSPAVAATLRSVWLDADGYGFIVGDAGMSYRIKPGTTGGTFSYTQILTDANTSDDKGSGIPASNLSSVQFSDRLTGYITGTAGLVLKTVDGGYHWKPESGGSATATGTPILALSSDAQNGTLIGADGSVQALNDQAEQFNSRFWYDELGRLVLSQNAKQFTISNYETAANLAAGTSATNPGTVRGYSYTLYDAIGRITEVGELLSDKPVVTAKNASQVSYDTHSSFVSSSFTHQVSKTYYDRSLTPPAGFVQSHLRNRVAYTTYQQEPTVNELQQTYYSYDVHGNVNSLLQQIRKDGQQLAKQIDYEYDLISGKVNKVYYQKGASDQLIHKYTYDGDNRITQVETSTDNVLFTKEASYQYYAHGPLARTTLGELGVETENYAYTIQGWIKQMQGQAFSYALGYNDTDYKAIKSTASVLATPIASVNTKSKGLYNGNIASMTSNTPAIASGNFQQQYSYDQLNRITESSTPGATATDAYRTAYSYDANGNIQTLARYDGSGAKFDQLSYNYETKANNYQHTTNKLRAVYDAIGTTATTDDIENQSADNYSYDAIGNLIADKQEQIDTIKWTVSGKVKKVIRKAGSIKPNLEFEYDASGQRIVKKVIKTDGTVLSTYYLRDATGNVMGVYTYNSLSDDAPGLSEQYLYGSSRIGVATPGAARVTNADGTVLGSRAFGRKSYELSDHLGNVRATLSDYRRLASAATVNSATDYYPFGMVARSYVSSVMPRYGYGGQEKDSDILEGLYTAEYWEYDSRLGRRWNIDPMFRKYAYQSTYATFNNNPIYFSDPFGLEGNPDESHTVQSGETFYSIGKKKGIDYKLLMEWNGFTEQTAKTLKTGASITLVDPKAKANATTTTNPLAGVAKPITSIEQVKEYVEAQERKWGYTSDLQFVSTTPSSSSSSPSLAAMTVAVLPRSVGGYTGLTNGAVSGIASGALVYLLATSTTNRPITYNPTIAITYTEQYNRQPGENIVYQIFSIDPSTGSVETLKYGVSGQNDFTTKSGNPRPEFQVNQMRMGKFPNLSPNNIYGYAILYITKDSQTARMIEQELVDMYYGLHNVRPPLQFRPLATQEKAQFKNINNLLGF